MKFIESLVGIIGLQIILQIQQCLSQDNAFNTRYLMIVQVEPELPKQHQ